MEKEQGREHLHALLQEVDPESARRLHPNDVKRVIRALEIYALTGQKKSAQKDEAIPRFPFCAVAYDYPRETLYGRIGRRVEEMFAQGLVDEVKGLLTRGVGENAQCMQGIGYKEVVEGLKNGDSDSTMSEIIKKNTRNYAKRQITFFKRTQNLHWLAPASAEQSAREVIELYER